MTPQERIAALLRQPHTYERDVEIMRVRGEAAGLRLPAPVRLSDGREARAEWGRGCVRFIGAVSPDERGLFATDGVGNVTLTQFALEAEFERYVAHAERDIAWRKTHPPRPPCCAEATTCSLCGARNCARHNVRCPEIDRH